MKLESGNFFGSLFLPLDLFKWVSGKNVKILGVDYYFETEFAKGDYLGNLQWRLSCFV